MIPKVLVDLIDKYKEHGIYIIYQNKMQWFNGKRFELISDSLYPYPILSHKNELFARKSYYELLIWKHKKFITYMGALDDVLYSFSAKFQIKIKDKTYALKSDGNLKMFDGTTTIKFPSPAILGFKILLWKQYIFEIGTTKSAKFDIITKKWYDTKLTSFTSQIYLLKDKIYLFYENDFNVYDLFKDEWESQKNCYT